MAVDLGEFEKRWKALFPKIRTFDKRNTDYRVNDLKTYAMRMKTAEADFAQAVADSQDEGNDGTTYKDHMKDKEVAKAYKFHEQTLKSILSEKDAIAKDALVAGKIDILVGKFKADLDKAVGKKPDPATKKRYDKLMAEVTRGAADLKYAKEMPKALPKDAAVPNNIVSRLNQLVKDAEKLPRKPAKPLPKEFDEKGWKALTKEMNEDEKALKAQIKAAGKGGSDLEDAVEAVEELVDKLKVLEAKLLKAPREFRLALRKAPHGDQFPAMTERVTRLNRNAKAELKKMQKAAKAK